MYRRFCIGLTMVLLGGGCAIPAHREGRQHFGEVGIRGDRFTVDGEPFLVVGIGYDVSARPGLAPGGARVGPELFRSDMERIVDAGFNTLRTWGPLTDDELDTAAACGLWVLQGVWFDPAGDFGDPAFRRQAIDLVRREVTRSAPHPNILAYLVMNEPDAQAVHRAGTNVVDAFFRELAATARRCDPRRPVSIANCVMTDQLSTQPWDVAAYNVYPYAPVTIEKVLGYRGYLDEIKITMSAGKPLLVTEFGLSVSPHGDGRGYGGNTLDQQRDGDVRLWNDVIQSGAAGGCVFMWTDGWWKHGNPDAHDDHAEEWYGLLEVDSSAEGSPRPAYFGLRDFNRAIRTLPRDGECYAGDVPVEVWSPRAARGEYRTADGPWRPLVRNGKSWWRGHLAATGSSAIVETRAIFSDETWTQMPAASIHLGTVTTAIVRFANLPASCEAGTTLPVEVEASRSGEPIAGRTVHLGRFVHTAWSEQVYEAQTDAGGVARFEVAVPPGSGFFSLAAAVDDGASPSGRAGVYAHVGIRP